MSDNSVKSVEAALEWSKQITTLSTGTLVLSGTFIKDVFNMTMEYEWIIIVCWILLGISILFGILYLGSLCSLLSNSDKNTDTASHTNSVKKLDIYKNPSLFLGLAHIIPFLLGLVLFITFISLNLK